MKFPASFYDHLQEHNYTEILGGIERKIFLEIWVVEVEGEVFARSWGKSKRSWYTAFLESGQGKLKYGNDIINVRGEKLDKESAKHSKINEAYLKRYTKEDNVYYAEGISQPEYYDYTMQFFYSNT